MAFQANDDADRPRVDGDDRQDFDPAVADQLSTLVLVAGQRNFQLNGVMARNQTAASAAVSTLGVQQNNAAYLKQLTKLTPLKAAAAANNRSSSDPSYFSILGTGARVPGG